MTAHALMPDWYEERCNVCGERYVTRRACGPYRCPRCIDQPKGYDLVGPYERRVQTVYRPRVVRLPRREAR